VLPVNLPADDGELNSRGKHADYTPASEPVIQANITSGYGNRFITQGRRTSRLWRVFLARVLQGGGQGPGSARLWQETRFYPAWTQKPPTLSRRGFSVCLRAWRWPTVR